MHTAEAVTRAVRRSACVVSVKGGDLAQQERQAAVKGGEGGVRVSRAAEPHSKPDAHAGANGRGESLLTDDFRNCGRPPPQKKHTVTAGRFSNRAGRSVLMPRDVRPCRYATDAISAGLFREVGRRRGVPCQEFAVRNDMPCGSTIGPILSAGLGCKTVDVGIPQLSMHR